jgi:methylglutaconyl-CoA hydratase
MKKIIWEGTDDWDTLLKRAAVSGELVLSDFTKALNQFKKIKRSVYWL